MKIKSFLEEAKKSKTAVFAFGRFNPISTGHELLANRVADVAKEHGGKAIIVASASTDSKKNPLKVTDKVKYMKKAFAGVEIHAANKFSPATFMGVAKALDKDYDNLIMVAGSDRIAEYTKILNAYNGKEYNYKSIKVISAGERDPDAEGVTGISGTKLREAAAKGDFKKFRMGTPKSLNDADVKTLMKLVKDGMKLKENINLDFVEFLSEGVHDKGIFKAVFLAGGPGSGKDYVLSNTLDGHGLTEINSDKALEYLMDKEDLDKRMPSSEEKQRNEVRGRAKNVTELRQRLALHGRNGLIINGTGDDPEKIKKIKDKLESLGYESSMIMVNTADEVSKQRNIERGQRGGRTVPESIRKEKWESVQAARSELAKMFKQNYTEFDNSEDLRQAPPDVVEAKTKEMQQIFKNVQKFVNKAPNNEFAKTWTANELEKKDTTPVSKQAQPHPEAGGLDKANTMGLDYYGFGRYGKNGKVTHRSVHGKLVAVTKEEPKTANVPLSGSSGSGTSAPLKDVHKKRLQDIKSKSPLAKLKKESVNDQFASFLEEAVTITITADTPEEATKTMRLLKSEDETKEVEEHYTFSNPGAFNALTLGKGMIKESHDNKQKYITDKSGKVRVFKVRNFAAKEAHHINGTVEKHDKGYVVKLKEEFTNEVFTKNSRTIQGQTSGVASNSQRSNYGFGNSSTEAQEEIRSEEAVSTKAKITLSEIRKRATQKESIDKGIEPGMALNSYSKEKLNKSGKAVVAELTGDETTASIGDQKEDELKKKGIDLSSFRKRNYV